MTFGIENIVPFKRIDAPLPDLSSIQDSLCNGLFEVMNQAFEERSSSTDNTMYGPDDIQSIIASYSQKNMVLAAASSVVPGPLGILSSVPQLLLNFKNQMNMIYDLGCATGKEKFINKDVLLDIPIAAFGGNTSLSSLQSNSQDLLDADSTILMDKAVVLGKSVIERTMKKSIVQFIPVAGPVLMGTWAKMTTAKISKGSISFLSDNLVYVEKVKPDESEEIQKALQIEKIKALANLIESNNEINTNQIDMISTIINNSSLDERERTYYIKEALKTGSQFRIDKELLLTYEEEEDLLMQMIIMAKRSGHIDDYEMHYIYKLGNYLDISPDLIDDLFE